MAVASAPSSSPEGGFTSLYHRMPHPVHHPTLIRSTTMSNVKDNLSEAGSHLKQAASYAGDSVKGAAAAAGDELRLGRANMKAELADSAVAGLSAAEEMGAAAKEQMDVLMDKGRDMIDSTAELIRERPLTAFGVAFAAGWVIAKLARSGGEK